MKIVKVCEFYSLVSVKTSEGFESAIALHDEVFKAGFELLGLSNEQ